MANEWIGIVTASAPKYVKGAQDLTVRKRLATAMLESHGRITLDADESYETRYDVDYKDAPIESFGDLGTVTYARQDYLKQANMDWRGYIATDLMGEKEYYMTKGQYALVRRYDRAIPKLVKGFQNQFGLEFYNDGNAAGYENKFCGIESFMGYTESPSASYLCVQPSDTYNGISTALNQSGRWTASLSTKPSQSGYDWPEGEGSPDFDFHAPKLVNWSSTAWGTGTATWEDNCERVLRRTMQWLTLTVGSNGSSLICYLAGHLMSGFKDRMSSKSRVLLPHKEASDLGFPQTLNFEGLGVTSEFGIAVNTGYVIDMDEVELLILTPELIHTSGPVWSDEKHAYLFSAVSFGNYKWSPKYMAKLKNFA